MATSMATISALADDLARVIQAAQHGQLARACLLTTRDREHALNVLRQVVSGRAIALYHFTVTGRRRYRSESMDWEVTQEDSDIPALLQAARAQEGPCVIILEDVLAELRDEGGNPRARMLLADMLVSEDARNGRVLVFLGAPEAETRLPSILADQFVRLSVGYPRGDELDVIAREEIAKVLHRARRPMPVPKIQLAAQKLTLGLAGLTRSAARDALRDALAQNPTNFEGAAERLEWGKALKLSRELAMNVLPSDGVEMPVGLDALVDYLLMNKDKMRVFGSGRARGILLIGPPGTGKTMLARAIGALVGLSVVEFRISALMNSLLGETEQRFARAFATLEAMAPNAVFIDEIEKAFGGDSAERDGGTMMRCTGSLLSWLSDNSNPNYIIATSNNLSRMGEIGLTMTRSERFDTAFFVDVPGFRARRRMLADWLQGKLPEHDVIAEQLAKQTEKFSGADLRSIVKQAIARAEHEKRALEIEHLSREVSRKRSRVHALFEEFQPLRHWGRKYCEPAASEFD